MKNDIQNAVKTLREGGVILYPTDTVWGLGCDPTNPEAVQKIYDIKKRDDRKSMLLIVDADFRIASYINEIPDIAFELIEVSEKPLTIIYPGAKNLSENLVAEDGSIGIRVSSDRFCQDLVRKFGKPIVSTSANISGAPAPAIFPEISEEILGQADYVVNWRQDDLSSAVPSSIIKLDDKGHFQIIRK